MAREKGGEQIVASGFMTSLRLEVTERGGAHVERAAGGYMTSLSSQEETMVVGGGGKPMKGHHEVGCLTD